MKKLINLLLALVLSLSVCTVFAADISEAQTRRFTDVAADDWYCAAIEEQVMKYNFIKGVSDTEFDPEGSLTRGQLVTILWRMDGEPLLTPEKDFAKFYFPNMDTDPIPEWAQNAAVWAGFHGIVKGYPDRTFRANEPVTREQMVTMLFRYAQYRGVDAVSLQESVTGFKDSDEISPYAISAVNWAVSAGIINGNADRMEPQRIASRADAATVVLRLQAYFDTLE